MALIEIKHFIKTYSTGDSSFNALDDVSLTVESGEFVAIMGASGSGKSTFMNMLGCLDKPTSGSYFLDGIDVSKMSMDELSEIRNLKLGFVFQGFNLISRTSAIENVEMPMIYKGVPPEQRIQRAKAALKIVGLEKREHHLPNQMSGGQQQRVGVARALVVKPEIIFADEPTGNLDSNTSKEIMNLMQSVVKEQNQTLIMVTHDNTLASFADKIIRIVDGRIVDMIDNTQDKSEMITGDNREEIK